MIAAIATTVRQASGWTRRVIALAAGAFGALALAPINIGPALILTFCVATWSLDGTMEGVGASKDRVFPSRKTLLTAFGIGWWLGFGYFLAGFWWLGAAFIIEPEFLWALPLGVVGLPALLALFTGSGLVVARLLWSRGPARILALTIGLGLAELARGHLFTGFPWNSFGMGLGGMLPTAQSASLVGFDGLTLMTIGIFATPATLGDQGARHWKPTAIASGALALLVAYGVVRLATGSSGTIPGATIRIVQPGLRPDEKFTYENRAEIVAHYIALSKGNNPDGQVRTDDENRVGKGLTGVKLLVWPESAFPFLLARDPDALAAIGAMIPEGTTLVTGAARDVTPQAAPGASSESIYYNDIMVIAHGGRIIQSYDKIHLVPFGEYLPFDHILRQFGLHNFVAIPGGFEAGFARPTLMLPGLPPAIPLICYEAIFSGEVSADRGGADPGFILNITNDGWFGVTPGPMQHLAQARLRAIEQGLPMIRGAATGISAIIDPYGRIVYSLPLGAEGTIDGLLPKSISETVFASWPKCILVAVWISTLLIWLALNRDGVLDAKSSRAVRAKRLPVVVSGAKLIELKSRTRETFVGSKACFREENSQSDR